MTDRMDRAREIAARLPRVAVTDKPRPGRVEGGVTFGRAKGAGRDYAPVSFGGDAFDAMTDEEVTAALAARWG